MGDEEWEENSFCCRVEASLLHFYVFDSLDRDCEMTSPSTDGELQILVFICRTTTQDQR